MFDVAVDVDVVFGVDDEFWQMAEGAVSASAVVCDVADDVDIAIRMNYLDGAGDNGRGVDSEAAGTVVIVDTFVALFVGVIEADGAGSITSLAAVEEFVDEGGFVGVGLADGDGVAEHPNGAAGAGLVGKSEGATVANGNLITAARAAG